MDVEKLDVGLSALTDVLGAAHWEKATGMWASGVVLVVGKWEVGGVHYEGRSKGETKNYAATSRLPGLKTTLDYYENESAAKGRVEKATQYWLRKLVASNAQAQPASAGVCDGSAPDVLVSLADDDRLRRLK